MRRIIVAGLGNPGTEYSGTRHNLGFWAIDKLVADAGYDFSDSSKLSCKIAELSVGDTKVMFVKPTTFYNESGQSIRAVMDFYKLDASDILIVHDELALPFGTIRARIDGSHAGNNGIKSVIAHVGSEFRRIRVGIKNELHDRIGDTDFVLGHFSSTETALMNHIYTDIHELCMQFITDPDHFAANTRRVRHKK